MTQQINHPDYIVIKAAPNVDIGDMAGEMIDLNKMRFLQIAIETHGCKLVPTPDLEFSVDGSVAQVFLVEKLQ